MRLFTSEDHALIMADLAFLPVPYQRGYLVAKATGLRREGMFTIKTEDTVDGICWTERMRGPRWSGKEHVRHKAVTNPRSRGSFIFLRG